MKEGNSPTGPRLRLSLAWIPELERDKFVACEKIVPGKAGQSPLFLKLAGNKMPPPDEKPRPTPAEVDALKRWKGSAGPQ